MDTKSELLAEAGTPPLAPQVPGVARLRLVLEAEEALEIPLHAGSVFRGAFGFALKRVTCAMKQRPCDGCPLEYGCVYTGLFETRPIPGSGAMTRYDRAPHPFHLEVEREAARLAAGDRFGVTLGLAGRSADWAVYAVRAMADAAAGGIGRGRGRMRLAAAEDGTGRLLLDGTGRILPPVREAFAPGPAPDRVRISFLSAFRALRDGKLVRPEQFDLRDLVTTALRRASMLSQFFGEGAVRADFAGLRDAAAAARVVERRLVWQDFARYSSRQKELLKMGGLTGEVVAEIGAAPELWAALRIGEHLGAGKGVTMGLGRMTVRPA